VLGNRLVDELEQFESALFLVLWASRRLVGSLEKFDDTARGWLDDALRDRVEVAR